VSETTVVIAGRRPALLRDILQQAGGFRVVAEARSGAEAIKASLRLQPQLVTIDLSLPDMGADEAVASILRELAVPIVVLIDPEDSRESPEAQRALARGAVELVCRPGRTGDAAASRDRARLVRTLRAMADVRVVRRARPGRSDQAVSPLPEEPGEVSVVIVDDSAVTRQVLCEVLRRAGGFRIVAEVDSGAAAIEACRRWQPKVVAMDLELPDMDGGAATARILESQPIPVVIVASTASQARSQLAMQALALGAVEITAKPERLDDERGRQVADRLVKTLRAMSRIRVLRSRPQRPVTSDPPPPPPQPTRTYRVVGIGASTGGPEALRRLIAQLPPTFPLPILVVQHMTPGYIGTLVEWLQCYTPLPVCIATAGPLPRHGTVLVAPEGQHMVVDKASEQIILDKDARDLPHHPAVDPLFQSLAAFGEQAIGVLLTGMGQDGAAGLLTMSQAGATTMAQDEESSVVWGMPAEAIQLGAARFIVAPEGAGMILQQECGLAPAP
jgi:two-component system chemotaxis response regulator CheB